MAKTKKPKHIAVAGNIGAGKTTLTELLSKQYKWIPHFEDVDHNPYLFDFYEDIRGRFPDLCVLASGGVRGVDDIKRLNDMGIFAVIFGKAYYEGILSLKDLEQFLIKKEA